MLGVIKTAITYIQSTHESYPLIDDNHFFMMWPQKGNQHIGRMPENFDVRAQAHQVFFSKLWINVEGDLRLHIDNNVYFDAQLRYFFNNSVKSGLLERVWPFQAEERGNHPASDKYFALGCEDSITNTSKIVSSIDKELRVAFLSNIGKASKSFSTQIVILFHRLSNPVNKVNHVVNILRIDI